MEQTIIQETNSNLQEDREQKLRSNELKIAELLDRLDPKKICLKAINEKLQSDEVVALQGRADELRKQEKELSAKVTPMDIHEAKLRKFTRDSDDLLALGKREEATAIEREKDIYSEDRSKLLTNIQSLNSQISSIEAQKKAILTPVFQEAFEQIKFAFADKLNFAATWIEKEFEEWVQLEEEFGIKTSVNPTNQMRLFREGPWRETRDRLDRWLP